MITTIKDRGYIIYVHFVLIFSGVRGSHGFLGLRFTPSSQVLRTRVTFSNRELSILLP